MYVPFNRLSRKHLSEMLQTKAASGEKAVANYDEDSFTMALSAAENCMAGSQKKPDALYFATTTPPNKEKQSAAHIASVMDMEGALRTADFGNSLRSGAVAMLGALDAARQGQSALVSAADMRLGAAGSSFESAFGDGAAAFCFGSENVIAEALGTYSVAYDFYDVWRTEDEKFARFFDEKYAQEQGYSPFVLESLQGVLGKTGITPEQIAKVVIDAPNAKQGAALLARAGFRPEQIQKELISDFGYCGAAYAPMLLACALEQSKPGDLILYLSYGEGSDAILFKAMEGSCKIGAGKGLSYFQSRKRSDLSYAKYLKWKKLLNFEPPRRSAFSRSNLPDFYRKRKKNLAFYGSVCGACGTPQYPPAKVCISCHSFDQQKPYLFKGKNARLATFSFDYVASSEDSPNVVAVVDFEGGGRIFTQLTDCVLEDVVIDMPVEVVYRKLYSADGITTYTWKCVPSAAAHA